MDSTLAKNKITNIVRSYQRIMPGEMAEFAKAQKIRVESNTDKFAEVKGTSGVLIRKLYEIPETLFDMLTARLTQDEELYLRSAEGGKWFAKTFREFRSSLEI